MAHLLSDDAIRTGHQFERIGHFAQRRERDALISL